MMVYKIGIMIVAVCLLGKIMGLELPQLQPSIPTDEDEALKDTQVMVPSIPDGIEKLPLEMLWKDVLKNPFCMSGGVPQPGTILSPTEEIFVNIFPQYKSLGFHSHKISSELRRGLLLDYLAKDVMPYLQDKKSFKQMNNNSDGIQVQNMNGNTFNFTMDKEMLFINGIKVTEVRSKSADKGPVVYIINGTLFNHMDIMKPKLEQQEYRNPNQTYSISYLQPSF